MRKDFNELFDLYFKIDKIQISKSELSNTSKLIKEGILIEEGEYFRINLDSDSVFENLIAYSEKILNSKFPNDILTSLKFYDEFYKKIKEINSAPYLKSFELLIEGFKTYILFQNNNQGKDITNFLFSITEVKRERDKCLYDYEKYYFKALLKLNIDLKTLTKVIKHSSKNDYGRYDASIYLKNICINNPEFAKEIIDNWYGENDLNLKYFQKQILVVLYDKECDEIFAKAFEVFKNETKILIDFLFSIEYKKEEHLKDAILFVENIEKSDNVFGSEIVQFYERLLKTNSNYKDIVFNKLYEYFDKDDENVRGWIIHSLIYYIEGFEEERYNFLHHILNKTKQINLIRDYFHNFKEPKYFFHLFQFAYSQSEFRTNLSLFENGISHFWQINHQETENYILIFLSHQDIIFRLGGIHLQLLGHLPINVLNINSEIGQLRALEAYERFPHSIENLVPTLLQFRNSKFKKVKEDFKLILGNLIFEAYHSHIYNLIINGLSSSKEDKEYKKYFKMILDEYEKMCKFKSTINDLSPNQNEYNFMDLYYRLEHENQAKMMEEVKEGKGSFLEHFGKNTIIVRANAWKLDEQDEVRPLGKVEHSIYVDGRIYKNPDLYEFILNSNKSNY